jgi:hypothetical protein
VAGGHVGVLSLLALCALAACTVAAGRLALRGFAGDDGVRGPGPGGSSIRGPLTYAGPGSLGGTDSGMRPRQ